MYGDSKDGNERSRTERGREVGVNVGLDLAPVTGEIRSAQAGIKAFQEGDPLGAALGFAGAVPGVGIASRAARVSRKGRKLARETESLWEAPEQRLTSASTSINKNKLPQGYTAMKEAGVFQPGQVVVDIGGGQYDNVIQDLAKQDVEAYVYDPFNRSADYNRATVEAVADGGADVAMSNNVLNVLESEASVNRVIRQADNAIRPGGKAYFSVYYAGPKFGQGRQTKGDSWQRNQKLSDYVQYVENVFGKGNVVRKNNLIIATKPE